VVEARRKAIEADIVIVNHHLLLADLALKEDGFGDLLGAADAVILDEAHQIPDLATQFFGTRLGSRQVELLVRDARQELALARAPAATLASRLGAVEKALAALAEVFAARRARLAGRGHAARRCRAGSVARAARAHARARTSTVASRASRSARRAPPSSRAPRRMSQPRSNEGARSVELTQRGFTLSLLPFDVAARFAR
jgi:ATP-dependent DNA helicase DinG